MVVQSPIQSTSVGRYGVLDLTFKADGPKTSLANSFFRTPLQVMRAIRDDAGYACVYLLSPTGGVVQGDRYDIRIVVHEHAHALVTTLAATKVYRMPDDCAVQSITIDVMDGAVLEFVPDALILFEDADFTQQIDIRLHGSAVCMFQDSVVPGRRASGEMLSFRQFRSRVRIWHDGQWALFEQQSLRPGEQRLTGLTTLGDHACWGSWFLLGAVQPFTTMMDNFCEAYTPPEGLSGSVSRLHHGGLCVRLLSDYWSPMADALESLRKKVRTEFMQMPYTNLRK